MIKNRNIFRLCDDNIIYKRKTGYSLNEILKFKQSIEPCEDDLLSLNHCVRVCYERNLPYSNKQVRKVFNKVFKQEFHGSGVLSWNFLKQWTGNKMIKFKSEVSFKAPYSPLEKEHRSPYSTDNGFNGKILTGVKK